MPNIEETPLADKKIESKKTDDSKPALGLFRISSKILVKKVCVSGGRKSSI